MSFRPSLKRTSEGPEDYEASFLASEHGMVKRIGITLDASLVSADSNGDKILNAGAALGKISASGKYTLYDNAGSDGEQVCTGFLMEAVNLRDGDVITGMLIHGSVLSARVSGLDSSGAIDLQGKIIFQ